MFSCLLKNETKPMQFLLKSTRIFDIAYFSEIWVKAYSVPIGIDLQLFSVYPWL